MTRPFLLCLLAAVAANALHAGAADLATDVARSDGWVGWRVPLVGGARSPCCYVVRHDEPVEAGCDLDARGGNFGTSDRDPRHDTELAVYAHVVHGRIEDVRAVGASCPVRTEKPIRALDAVEPSRSIELLAAWATETRAAHADIDSALAAIAYHGDPAATRALATLAEPAHTDEVRQQALFWLARARGAEGAEIVERHATTDADPDVREHAIFALSQASGVDAYARILAISRSDRSDHVRSQALFWMAQMDDPRAAGDIANALDTDASADVREQAVFALSQLDGDRGEDALIAILRGDYPRETKKQALFWLGQSGSARALQLLDEVLAESAAPSR
ncbi:MAG TPA: HEAT repeat domain-containing protein [Dokdonella sp.]|nr:HEAT repeat domain-containing protein [Dokdonella sp.]